MRINPSSKQQADARADIGIKRQADADASSDDEPSGIVGLDEVKQHSYFPATFLFAPHGGEQRLGCTASALLSTVAAERRWVASAAHRGPPRRNHL